MVWDGGIAQMSWGRVSPPAAPQTWPHAAQAASLCLCCSALCAALSPAPADAALRETTPADSKNEDASGHANVSAAGMAAGYDKWDNRKLKGWVTKISLGTDWKYYIHHARVPRLIRKHHIHLYETANTFILSRPQTWQDKKYWTCWLSFAAAYL